MRRFVSWNVNGIRACVRKGFLDWLPDAHADVIGLQEIVMRRDGFDQAALVLAGLGYTHVFGAAFHWNDNGRLPLERTDGDAFGNVVASRWPIAEASVHPLPGRETEEYRSLLATRIETPAGVLPFFTTHLNWKFHHGVVRERQVVAIAEVVERVAAGTDFPPILVGDLNADPFDGGSVPGAIDQLLTHPRINASFVPRSDGAAEAARAQEQANRRHRGRSEHDTADFSDRAVGNLRVDYVLPSTDLTVVGGGVFWPPTTDPRARLVRMTPEVASSDHRLVYLDVQLSAE